MTATYLSKLTVRAPRAAGSIDPMQNLSLPLYLAPDVQADLIALAAAQGVTLADLANDLLKKGIASLKAGA
jgi:hypothetical protein